MTTTPGKPSFLASKATLDTKFHIDYAWWEKSNEDLRTYLLSHVQQEQRERLSLNPNNDRLVDYIDPETGEVFQLDELNQAIQMAAERDDFINEHVSLVDCVFRAFLESGNLPLSSNELSERIGRKPDTILKTIGGHQIYKGIRRCD